MKFAVLHYLVVGASIAQHVVANPMRIVVVTSTQELSPSDRTGHEKPSFITAFVESDSPSHAGSPRRRPCHASGLSHKAAELADSFRDWFGFPVKPKAGDSAHGEAVQVLPLMPIKTFGSDGKTPGGDDVRFMPHPPHHHHHPHSHHHGNHHSRHFWVRVHNALMALGPWEGRAVAFVLGCGIGVLLRMLFVMAVLSYRMIKGDPENSRVEYFEVVCDDYRDAEHILVPPPQYVSESVERENLVDVKEGKVEDKDEVTNGQA